MENDPFDGKGICYGCWDIYLCRHPDCPFCKDFDKLNSGKEIEEEDDA